MLNAPALIAVDDVEKTSPSGLSGLVQNDQNMIIESVNYERDIPEPLINLSVHLLTYDDLFKDTISYLRSLYGEKRADFHISLKGKNEEDKQRILNLLQVMYGVISSFYYSSDSEMINGKLTSCTKAKNYICGQYMEIAVYKRVKDILGCLAEKYDKEFEVYPNVRVATREGRLKNEFDLVIVFDGIFYAVEVKSGKNFRELDRYMDIGLEYKIVPKRFLLVDNYMTSDEAAIGSYFCEYYVSNLEGGSLEKNIIAMIENDMKEATGYGL